MGKNLENLKTLRGALKDIPYAYVTIDIRYRLHDFTNFKRVEVTRLSLGI